MIHDREIIRAVSRIRQRSERERDIRKVKRTFVDVGVLDQLDNDNHQIIFGRRGTGKTHLLKVLDDKLKTDQNRTVVYIDARTLGSTAQFSDPTVPLRQRCVSLFRDILGEICNALLEHIVDFPGDQAERAFDAVDLLASVITNPVDTVREQSVVAAAEATVTKNGSTGIETNVATGPALRVSRGETSRTGGSVTTSFNIDSTNKIIFKALHRHLSDVLVEADTTVFVLLDEWSSIPAEVQPYIAEFLKRSLLTVDRVVVKIASIEYRSHFSLADGDSLVGFELGADIATSIDLDDYFVFERNPEALMEIYADMLLRHISAELQFDYLRTKYQVFNASDLQQRLFSEKVFVELARAAEGVARDLINIFSLAFSRARRKSQGRRWQVLDRNAILETTHKWFERDKLVHLDVKLQKALHSIVSEVVGKRRSMYFLLTRELEMHPLIQRLFDARVIHLVERGFMDPVDPGERFSIYALDYGTYVGVVITSRVDYGGLAPTERAHDFLLPSEEDGGARAMVLKKQLFLDYGAQLVTGL